MARAKATRATIIGREDRAARPRDREGVLPISGANALRDSTTMLRRNLRHRQPYAGLSLAPSGGRMDEIIRAVRDCPSGGLSYAIGGVEDRAAADRHGRREPTIEVSKDGPDRITGGIELLDGEGNDLERNAGASREHYAPCRCGHSQNVLQRNALVRRVP